eukprot:g2160.t1
MKPLESIIETSLDTDDWGALISFCEEKDFRGEADENTFMALMFGYLLNEKLEAARLLGKRFSNNRVFSDIWLPLGQPLYEQDMVRFQKSVAISRHSGVFKRLLDRLSDVSTASYMSLIGRAYTKIRLSVVAPRLGVDESVAVQRCTKKGWLFDEQSQMLTPVEEPALESMQSGLQQLHNLRKYVTFLESELDTKSIEKKLAKAAKAAKEKNAEM